MRLLGRSKIASVVGVRLLLIPLTPLVTLVAQGVLLDSAFAQGTGGGAGGATDAVAAEALFDEGRRLVTLGKFAEACPKFADSQRLDPSPGTQLNLASCWEKLGRTASAWATYRAAASAASATGRKDLLAVAQKHAETLAPKLAKLTLIVPQGVDGLEVKRDGALVPAVEYGLAIPVDLGSHTIEVTAKGFKPWSKVADVQESASVSVTVPALEPAPAGDATPAGASPTPPPVAPPPVVPPPPESDPSRGKAQRMAGIVVGSVGIVGLGTAGVLAGVAKSKYNTSLGNCEPNDHSMCSMTGVSQRDTARGLGNGATAAVIAGGVAVAAGAVLWIFSPRASSGNEGKGHQANGRDATGRSSATLWIAPTVGGAVMGGGF